MRLAGKVDVILYNGEGIEIRDFKTSDTVVTEDDASMQIRFYARGLTAIGEQVTRRSIAFLEDATVTPAPVSENLLTKVESYEEELISGIVKRNLLHARGITAIPVILERYAGFHENLA